MAFAVPILQTDFLKIHRYSILRIRSTYTSNVEWTAEDEYVDGGEIRFAIMDFRATVIMSDY